MKKVILLFLSVLTLTAVAQVTTVPSIIQKGYTGEVTIIFNPNEGNGGMAKATQCYAHTGITYDGQSWQKANAKWRDGLDKYKMTKNADGNWELKITPDLYSWYGAISVTVSRQPGPDGKPVIVRDTTILDVTQLCFVFNDGPGGELEGKAHGGADIFIDLVEPGLSAMIATSLPEIVSLGQTVNLNCVATETADLKLTLNGEVVASGNGKSLVYQHTFNQSGDYVFELTATNANGVSTDRVATLIPAPATKANRPAGIVNGIYYDSKDNTKVTLCTYAGSKTEPAKHVFVVGDFNNWTLSNDYQLKQANDSAYFWTEIKGLTPQKEYAMQYVVIRADGVIKRISDLYSTKVLHPDDQYEPKTVDPSLMAYPKAGDSYVTVIQTDKPEYKWSDATLNFKRPNKNNLIIYELWVYDYTPVRSLNAVANRLDYLATLGVNAIELMPLSEFDGNYNWGYSPNHYFSFDKAYGTPNDLKKFVDLCHQRGIAVIVDMVFNHATGLNPMNKLYPYGDDLKYNPWFNTNPPHGDNVYEDWNHDFAPTKTMFTRALQYWLKEYKVDGFRMDLSHGLCGTTNDALTHIADYYNNGVKAVAEDAYFILEHWGSNIGSDRPKLINQGMLCWDNTSNAYHQTAMGWLKDGDDFSNANRQGYVTYCESHDEERMQYKVRKYGNGDLKTNEEARLNRVAANVVFNVLLAGPHMIWQYEEIGYDFSINSSYDAPTAENNDNRCAIKPQPKEEGYFQNATRMQQYTKIAQAIRLRTELLADEFISLGKPTKTVISSGKALRTIQWGDKVFVAGNFDASANQAVTIPGGTWYNYYDQKQQTISTIVLKPGEFVILTGQAVQLPKISTNFDFLTGVEDVVFPGTTEQILPPYNVTIYTISGQVVSLQKNVEQVNMGVLKNGLYLIQFEKNGKTVTKKVIR